MARNGRKNADPHIIAALAAGKCVRTAAEECHVSDRTIFRRLQDPTFRKAVDEARAEMIGRATGQLSDAATEAVATLRRLLTSSSDTVKLGAARSILEFSSKLKEATEVPELIKRIESLEKAAAK